MSAAPRAKNHWQLVLLSPLVKLLDRIIASTNLWLLKKSNGRLGNRFLGVPVLLLYTTGAKSGVERVTPLFYLQYEEKVLLVGSHGGSMKNPAWVINLNANPKTVIGIKGTRTEMLAHFANEEEHQRYWPMLTEMFPVWKKFQEKSGRRFPVVVLEPR